jgi:hypothetical protein
VPGHRWKKGELPGKKYLWKKGQSGNPAGRPKLPAELNEIKRGALQKAIEILSEKMLDPVYVASLRPDELGRLLEITFDRFGLPKVSKTEMSGPDGKPIRTQEVDLGKVNAKMLEELASELNGSK